MGEPDGIDTLRSLIALCRETGATRARLRDGTEVELDSKFQPPQMQAPRMALDPLDNEVDTEERRQSRLDQQLRAEWDETWSRYTASSGAPIPPYPGGDRARAWLSRRA